MQIGKRQWGQEVTELMGKFPAVWETDVRYVGNSLTIIKIRRRRRNRDKQV